MSWYAAHIVMLVRFKRGIQRQFPAWENIVLIQAAGEEAAIMKAEAIGMASGGDDDGSFRWRNKPANWEFGGVRKVTECSLAGDRPAGGDEVTYNELEFESLADAKKYASGRAVTARHQDQIKLISEAKVRPMIKPRRKRA